MTPLGWLAAGLSGLVVGLVMALLVPPTPRLAGRVQPYLHPEAPVARSESDTAVGRVLGPILSQLADAFGRRLDSGDDEIALRLRQSGLFPDVADDERLAVFRIRQLRALAIGGVAGGVVAATFGYAVPGVLGLAIAGAIAGVGRTRGRVERAVEDRSTRMRIEIYTICQLLSLRVRAGGAVMQAVSRVVERGRGEVAKELAEGLRLHRAGLSASEAFGRIADLTPEPACARTYRLLAVADERGVDLAAGLLALAEDVREARREAMKRSATKRRAAMLIPTIALLAPTLILFVAAPLPFLLTGWR